MSRTLSKIFRDPVHGFIEVERSIPLRLIDSEEFQRLRRIRQLGFTSLTYPGGEHTRFSHSLGVFHLFSKVTERLRQCGIIFSDEELLVGSLTALLHDVGHCPFSHALEGIITPKKHEEWTIEALTCEESSINRILRELDKSLPSKITSVIRGGYERKLIISAVSSQFDVDRMDYLLRDSLATGTSYGNFDLDRVLVTLETHNDQLAFGDKYLAEQFIFARYFAYWQTYFHKTTRGMECLMKSIWRRAKNLYSRGLLRFVPDTVKPFLDDKTTFHDYFSVDDTDILLTLKYWSRSEDRILRDLSSRLIARRPFKSLDISSVNRLDISEVAKDILTKAGYPEPEYYFLTDSLSNVPYDYYTAVEEEEKPPIWVRDSQTGKFTEISRISDPIRAIAGQRISKSRVYLPDANCVDKLRKELFEEGS